MSHPPLVSSMMDLLSHISLPAAEAPLPAGDVAVTDPHKPISQPLEGPHAVLDGLLAEVEQDLMQGRQDAASTALGLAGTRISLDAMRGVTPPRHVEWLAAFLRSAATELAEGHPGKALKAVRLGRLAMRT